MEIETLCQQFCDYSTHIRGLSPDTIRKYKSTITTLRRSMHIEDIAQCSGRAVHDFFYRGSAHRGWVPGTSSTYYMSLVVFFRWCVKQGHLAATPMEGIELPKKPRHLPRNVPADQARRLLELVRNYPWQSEFERWRNLAIIATFIYAGLRRRELLRLEVVDADLAGHTIFVRSGKGAKDRFVPILAALRPILDRYAEARRTAGKTCPQFFASTTLDAGFSDDGLKHLIRRISLLAKIPFSAHRLRHTYATMMLDGGCDLFKLSQMMGHSNITTTTIYLSTTTENLQREAAKHALNYL